MIAPKPVVLERHGIRLEPIGPKHHDGLVSSAADGELWNLRFTSVPDAPGTPGYIADAPASDAKQRQPNHEQHGAEGRPIRSA